jgi:hypothetical protein
LASIVNSSTHEPDSIEIFPTSKPRTNPHKGNSFLKETKKDQKMTEKEKHPKKIHKT